MNVASLQMLLRNHAEFLAEAGGTAKLISDLRAVADGFIPLAEMKLDELVVLLQQANEYRTTGVLPVKPGRKAPAVSAVEKTDAAIRTLRDLYDRAIAADFTFEALDEAFKPIAKLTVPQLKDVARGLEIANIPAKKADLLAALRKRIEERREMHQRSNIAPA